MLLQTIKENLTLPITEINFLESGYKIVVGTAIKDFDVNFTDAEDVENFQFIISIYNQDFISAIRKIKVETETEKKVLKTSIINSFKENNGVLENIYVVNVKEKLTIKPT